MIRVAVALFLVAHGLVHLMYFAPKPQDDATYPFVPETRWIARVLGLTPGAAKTVARGFAVVTAAAFVVAGVALLVDASIWEPAALIASGVSLVLMLLFFHPWLSIGIAIDLAIVASIGWLHVPASLFEG